MKRYVALLVTLVLSLDIMCACSNPVAKEETKPIPYEDLSEEAYLQNARNLWEKFSAYLATSDDEDFQSVFANFRQKQGERAPEDFGAIEMIDHFEEHLLQTSGETRDSFEAMPEDKKTTLREKNSKEIQKQIPNALKVQQDVLEKRKHGEGIIGSYTFKDRGVFTAYEDGTIGYSAL